MTGFGNQKFMNPQFTAVGTLSSQANSLVYEINKPGFNKQNEKMNESLGVIVNPLTYEIKVIPVTKTKTPKENEISNSKKKPTQETIIPQKQNFSANTSTVTIPSVNKKDKEEKKKEKENKEEKNKEGKVIPTPAKTEAVVAPSQVKKEVQVEQVSQFKNKEKFKTGTFDFMLKYGMNPDKVSEIINSTDSDKKLLEKYSVTEIAFAKVLKKDKEGNYFVNNAEIQNWAKMVDGITLNKEMSIGGESNIQLSNKTEDELNKLGFYPKTICNMLEAAEKGESLVGKYPASALFLVGLMKKKGNIYLIDGEGIKKFKQRDKEHWASLRGDKKLEENKIVSPETNKINPVQEEKVEDAVENETVPPTPPPAEQVVKKKKKTVQKSIKQVKKEKQIEKNNDELTEEQKKRVEARKKADI